ncbi:MAG TPA: glycosyltransferase family 4 protein [Verrucomicrobiota bacterium]|nr:glycosyltransferase family 4 protein [Verrucomicrobiota bacterium]
MKVLVFAHTPPPHHGQSYMVQMMLKGFGGDCRKRRATADELKARERFGIQCYHVNVRLSKDLENIGDLQVRKLALVFWYCLQAIWCRFRHGVKVLYYIPAPGKWSALYRDWMVMLLCRPFFPHLILHWHAAGLDRWLEMEASMLARSLTYRSLGKADVSVALSGSNCRGVGKFLPRRTCVVFNAIPDPCPDYDSTIRPRRTARHRARSKLLQGQTLSEQERIEAGGDPEVFHCCYLALCTQEKGLFDAVDAVCAAQRELEARGSPIRLKLTIAGGFTNAEERAEFEQRRSDPVAREAIRYVGFVHGEQKHALLRDSDALCFPTYYRGENHPVSTVEALAYGLPVIITRWRSLPEFFPAGYPSIVEPKDVKGLTAALLDRIGRDDSDELRQLFLERYTIERHLETLAAAIRSVGDEASLQRPEWLREGIVSAR